MPFSIDLSTVTVTMGPFLDFMGYPVSGSVTFTPSTSVTHLDTGTPILNKPVVVSLALDGRGSVTLPATDDPRLTPLGFTYVVSYNLNGPSPSAKAIALPAGVGVVDLDLMTPVTSSTGTTVEVPDVLSVAGLTGAITAQELADQLSGLIAGGGGSGDGTVVSASTTVRGIVELATTAETTTGTDAVRATTPAGVKAVADTKAALSHTHTVTDIAATGTKSATTFLRGDNTWSVPAGGGGTAVDPNKLDIAAAPELIRDTIDETLVAGTNITIVKNDAANITTISAPGAAVINPVSADQPNVKLIIDPVPTYQAQTNEVVISDVPDGVPAGDSSDTLGYVLTYVGPNPYDTQWLVAPGASVVNPVAANEAGVKLVIDPAPTYQAQASEVVITDVPDGIPPGDAADSLGFVLTYVGPNPYDAQWLPQQSGGSSGGGVVTVFSSRSDPVPAGTNAGFILRPGA
jgi:hypothetical protein